MGDVQVRSATLRQADFEYLAYPVAPLFNMSGELGRLMTIAHREFGRFGLRPTDMRIDPTWTGPNDLVLVCSMFDFGVTVRFKATQAEVWTRNQTVAMGADSTALMDGVLITLIELGGSERGILGSQTLSIAAHATLAEGSTTALLGEHVVRTQRALPLEPQGVNYEAALEPGGRATVDLYKSLLFPSSDTLWLRVLATYPGSLSASDARTKFAALLTSVGDGFGLIIVDPQSRERVV